MPRLSPHAGDIVSQGLCFLLVPRGALRAERPTRSGYGCCLRTRRIPLSKLHYRYKTANDRAPAVERYRVLFQVGLAVGVHQVAHSAHGGVTSGLVVPFDPGKDDSFAAIRLYRPPKVGELAIGHVIPPALGTASTRPSTQAMYCLLHSPLVAAPSAAMSMFSICLSADQTLSAFGPFANSMDRCGTIRHDNPKRSFSQPHWLSAPPSVMSDSGNRGTGTVCRQVLQWCRMCRPVHGRTEFPLIHSRCGDDVRGSEHLSYGILYMMRRNPYGNLGILACPRRSPRDREGGSKSQRFAARIRTVDSTASSMNQAAMWRLAEEDDHAHASNTDQPLPGCAEAGHGRRWSHGC